MALDFFAGSCGGASGIATGYPLDTVKVLMQTQAISSTGDRKYRSTFQTISRVTREEGLRRLYRGLQIGVSLNYQEIGVSLNYQEIVVSQNHQEIGLSLNYQEIGVSLNCQEIVVS